MPTQGIDGPTHCAAASYGGVPEGRMPRTTSLEVSCPILLQEVSMTRGSFLRLRPRPRVSVG